MDEARDLRRSGKRDEARALLDKEPPGPACAAAHLGLSARLHLDAGRSTAAVEGLVAARDAALPHQGKARVDDGLALAYVLTLKTRDFGSARALLADLATEAEVSPQGRARVPYYGGLLALETGDLRTAVRHLARSAERARELAMTPLGLNAQQLQAETLMRLGRGPEALAILDRLVADDGLAGDQSPCQRARVYANLGWLRLLERERVGVRGPDPRAAILSSLEHYRAGCDKASLIANAHVNLALDAVQRGDLEAAGAALAAARAAHAEPDAQTESWMLDIEGRAARMAGSHGDARAIFDRLHAQAPPGSGEQLRALLGTAETLVAAGQTSDAIAAYRRLEDALDHAQGMVPLGAGRDTFLASYDRGTRRLIEQQVAARRPGQALRTARRARARLLDALVAQGRLQHLSGEALARWDAALGRHREAVARANAEREALRLAPDDERPAIAARRSKAEAAALAAVDAAYTALDWRPRADLGRPAPGTLMLVWYPVDGGFMGFAAAGSTVQTARIESATVSESGPAALLTPFDEAIATATRIELLPAGEARRWDLHAASWRGRPLLAHAPVAYRLDLPPTGQDPPGAPQVLVVSDPSGDLPGARADGRAVAARLGAGDAGPVRHISQLDTTDAAVRGALRAATHLHWAGHATFGGVGGWGSELALARGAHLGPADILALPRVPRTVVLLACESGKTSAGTVETVGLAQAFLAAGALGVIATTRPIHDQQAAKMSTELYRGDVADLPATLRQAQLRLAKSCADCDWSAFRALVP